VWSWLGSYDLARDEAAERFGEAEIVVVPMRLEHGAEQLNALMRTMSFWARLKESGRTALDGETLALEGRLGRPIRSSALACLVAARRL
jgi:hypothetical protein